MTPTPPPAGGPAPQAGDAHCREPSPAEERAYFLRRAADHDRLADAADAVGQRALHQRFALLYRGRAGEAAMMQED